MNADHFLDRETYHRLVAALADLKPGHWDRGRLDPDEIKLLLGEAGGVWPASVLAAEIDGPKINLTSTRNPTASPL